MSMQDLGSNYPDGYDTCLHEMPYSGLDCVECAAMRARDTIDELHIVIESLFEKIIKNSGYNFGDASCELAEVDQLTSCIKIFINKVGPEIDSLKKISSSLREHNKKLIEFARLVKECPNNSVHLMSLAADALLRQLPTDSVGSEEEDNGIKSSSVPF